MNRRSFLRTGAVFFGGPLLADLMRLQAAAKSAESEKRSVIVVFQAGGPSHLETWDMKPNAPVEYRGEFNSIQTNLPGYRIGEYTPRLAKLCDRLAILRSVYHDQTEHGQACHVFMTGYKPTKNDPGNEFPSCGSIISRELGPRKGQVPPYVATMTSLPSSNASYLGLAHNPFQTYGYPTSPYFRVRNLQLPDGVDARRLKRRRAMLNQFDTLRREADATGALEGMDAFTRQAFEMVASPSIQKALDLNLEPKALRERYGANSFGAQSLLLARRLVEGGARFVTVRVDGQWDSHKDNFPAHRNLLPPFDQGVAALIEDLEQKGLLKTTLLIIGGEFGRTPRINKDAGRDHWPSVYTTVLAGGGVKGGVILGESDALGETPKTRPIHHQDVLATMYQQLGIDWKKTYYNEAQRPVEILNQGAPINEILE
jgi:Protein of unknown function (DUF1501)